MQDLKATAQCLVFLSQRESSPKCLWHFLLILATHKKSPVLHRPTLSFVFLALRPALLLVPAFRCDPSATCKATIRCLRSLMLND